MARSDTSIPYQLQLQAGTKLFVTRTAVTTANVIAATPGTTKAVDGTPIQPGALLMIQGDADFYYRNCAAGATPGTTAINGLRVYAGQQEFFHLRNTTSPDGYINIAQDGGIDCLSVSGTANIYLFVIV